MISQLLVHPIQVINSIEELNHKGMTAFSCDYVVITSRLEVNHNQLAFNKNDFDFKI